jgi:TonB family protein
MFHLFTPLLAATLVAASGPVSAQTHGASCAADDRPARVARAVTPETPAVAEMLRLSGTTIVRVDLSNTGDVVGAAVARSSGSSMLDRAALAAARAQAYAPQIKDCRPVAGSYAIAVEFTD